MSVNDRQISEMISTILVSPLTFTRMVADVGLDKVKEELRIQDKEIILTSWRESRC
jgi:hypothetical protein